MAEGKNTKKRLIVWLLLVAALVLAAAALGMARYGMGIWPYPVAAAAAVLLIVAVAFLRPNWAALSATLASLAFLLRFAARGYAWWGYALLFVAALVVLHRFLPAVLWKLVVVLTCVGLVYFCFVESFIIRNARTDPQHRCPAGIPLTGFDLTATNVPTYQHCIGMCQRSGHAVREIGDLQSVRSGSNLRSGGIHPVKHADDQCDSDVIQNRLRRHGTGRDRGRGAGHV